MIVALVTFLTMTGPLGTFRSIDTFETMASCEAFLAEERARHVAARAALAARIGVPVAISARCVDLTPGVPT